MPIRKVKCKGCSKLYPSKVEDDYSDYCAKCEEQNQCPHKHIEKGFVDGGALGETCKDCGKTWRSTWQGD